MIDHGTVGHSDQRKLHIGERADIAVCILEFRVKRCTDTGGFMLCGTSEQRETEQKRYELFHWYCPQEFAYMTKESEERDAMDTSILALRLTGDHASMSMNAER